MKTAFQQWVDYLFPNQKEEIKEEDGIHIENMDYLRGFNDALKLIKETRK